MGTLMYSPGIQVKIATANRGVIDVSDDIARGSVSMTENDLGNVSLVLTNHRRKYDGVFSPNDRITIRMKRIAWVQVFSGYLDQVPYFSVYPREVPLTATCSLKRLLYHPWDPGSTAAWDLLNSTSSTTEIDGGVKAKLLRLLTEVAEWPQQNIHIGSLPTAWYDRAQAISEALSSRITVTLDDLGLGATSGNSTVGTTSGSLTAPGIGPFTGALPATSGKISWFGGPGGGAYGNMALTGESGINPTDPWYAAMRFPYQAYVGGFILPQGTAEQRRAAQAWWKNRKLLVVHSTSGKAVVVRAADWGPGGVKSADGRAIDVSKTALAALGAKTDDLVEIRFAAEGAALGPVTASTATSGGTTEAAPITSAAPSGNSSALSGLSFTPRDRLQGNTAAARDFIRAAWPEAQKNSIGGYQNRNIAGSSKKSDHASGLALDVGNGSGNNKATEAQRSFSTSVAAWFIQNPKAFGTKYVIWDNKINTGDGRGWRLYNAGYVNNMNLGHYNHVHISFNDTRQTALGPMGSPWAGSDMVGFPTYASPASSGTGGNLINAFNWIGGPSEASAMLYGIRALMNDEPILNTVRDLAGASMRSMMSGPNGDFISWFPDYFGTYKTAGVMNVRDIELADDGFTIQWSDARLKTHIYATGSATGFGTYGGLVDLVAQATTSGIASVEFPEMMEALFNISASDPRAKMFLDAKEVFARFGARPESISIGTITGAQAEFWYALSQFQRNWANQFSSTVNLTFMPEVFPGMLLRLPTYKFQAYVTNVNHSFDFESGGFTTSVSVIAPSATDGSGLFGLPRGA